MSDIKKQIILDENISEEIEGADVALPKKRKSKKLFIIVCILILLSVLVGAFFYNRYTKTEAYKQKKADKEAAALVKEVGKLMILPEGKPKIFVVEDPDVLIKQQAFFKGAMKDDRLLFYSDAAKAIIYSPKRHLIVNVGPVTFDGNKEKEIKTEPKPIIEEKVVEKKK